MLHIYIYHIYTYNWTSILVDVNWTALVVFFCETWSYDHCTLVGGALFLNSAAWIFIVLEICDFVTLFLRKTESTCKFQCCTAWYFFHFIYMNMVHSFPLISRMRFLSNRWSILRRLFSFNLLFVRCLFFHDFSFEVRTLLASSEHLAQLCAAQRCNEPEHPILDYDQDPALTWLW